LKDKSRWSNPAAFLIFKNLATDGTDENLPNTFQFAIDAML
jgi:hypothetical protein